MQQSLEYRIQTLEDRVELLVAFLSGQPGIDPKALRAALQGVVREDDEAPGKLD